jgi:hypothetical protein
LKTLDKVTFGKQELKKPSAGIPILHTPDLAIGQILTAGNPNRDLAADSIVSSPGVTMTNYL